MGSSLLKLGQTGKNNCCLLSSSTRVAYPDRRTSGNATRQWELQHCLHEFQAHIWRKLSNQKITVVRESEMQANVHMPNIVLQRIETITICSDSA